MEHAASIALLLAGAALFAAPLAAPPAEPADTVTYTVERTDGDVDSWETLDYGNLSDASRAAFDAAREGGPHNVTVQSDESLPPLADDRRPVVAYDLRYDGQWYLLEVTHYDPSVPTSAYLLRAGALGLGVLLAAAGGYRAVTA